ncbi:malic enzyme [Pelomyxa schiedti]|nr:malic enzyme [Pelomyxa schiedti]
MDLLRDPARNKGTAFTLREREENHARGLLPWSHETLEQQAARAYAQLCEIDKPLRKYIFLDDTLHRNRTLYYYLLSKHIEELLPIVYTPTVAEACIKFGLEFRAAFGMYFCIHDRHHIRRMLDNWTRPVDLIVVTDGGRILGLGDLGTNGMGIPIGKLALYVAAACFNPDHTLPVMLDVGTNNRKLLEDPYYLGVRAERLQDDQYFPLVEEFMTAVMDKWPHCLVQFEDFQSPRCFTVLDFYKEKYRCFNDDIQGTGAVIVSGLINAMKATRTTEHRVLFFGAGSAATGVASMLSSHISDSRAIDISEARKMIYMFDIDGLVCTSRGSLATHLVPFARDDMSVCKDFLQVVKSVQPTILIGLSGAGSSFSEEILREMAKYSAIPIIFALSNPTANAECTAEQAYTCTDGKCIFASGSPFPPYEYKGVMHVPGQGNNMFIFPGLGLGAWLAQSKIVTDRMILVASRVLANCVADEDISRGKIYPDLPKIQDITRTIAAAVIEQAFAEGVAMLPEKPKNLLAFVAANQWEPFY